MATFQFNPANPFNIRGVSISPANPNAPFTAKHDVYNFLYFVDTVAGTNVIAGDFTLSNLTETGSLLNYQYSGSLTLPTQNDYNTPGRIQTIALPLYTNQKIDKPNTDQNNLTAVLTVIGNNKTAYKGDPQLRKPPVYDQVYNVPHLTCCPFVINSATDSSGNCLVVLANTGDSKSLNFGSITSYGADNGYSLIFQFAAAGTGGKPGQQHHGVVCVGFISNSNLSVYTSVQAQDSTGEFVGPVLPLDFSTIPVHTPPM